MADPAVATVVAELHDVTVRHGEVVALDGVTLRVVAGERVAIIGPSGAGKTTTLAVINTALAPTTGTLNLFGSAVAGLSAGQLRDVRRRIAVVPQGLHLPGSLKVVHNVNAGRLGRWSTPRALISLVRPRELDDTRAVLADFGIEHTLKRRTDSLSGGERQRVALARVVVQRADLVLADEPVASLDPARAREVVSALVAAAGGDAPGDRALIVSLHDVEIARAHFDRIVGIRAGRIEFDLPASDVDDDIAAALYDLAAT